MINNYDIIDTKEKVFNDYSEELSNSLLLEDELNKKFKTLLLENYGIAIFKSWFNDLKFVLEEDLLIIKAATPFKADWLLTNYLIKFIEIAKNVEKKVNNINIVYK